MHFAQSQENLSRLINFLRLREKDFDLFNAELFFEMNALGMPYAQIHWDNEEHEILYYIDDFSSYWYDWLNDS